MSPVPSRPPPLPFRRFRAPCWRFFDISDPEKSFMQIAGHYTDIDIPRRCCARSRRVSLRKIHNMCFIKQGLSENFRRTLGVYSIRRKNMTEAVRHLREI